MEILRSTMLTLLSMAALTQLITIFSGEQDSRGALNLICGLCAALCMLNAYRELAAILK